MSQGSGFICQKVGNWLFALVIGQDITLCRVPGLVLIKAFSWRGRSIPPFGLFGQDPVCSDEGNEPLVDVFVFNHVGLGDFHIVDYFRFHSLPD